MYNSHFNGAHYATFPEELARLCIAAGTSLSGCCVKCGAPRKRVSVRTGHVNNREPARVPGDSPTKSDSSGWLPTSLPTDYFEDGCECHGGHDAVVPCRVLDIFGGSGTTVRVGLAMNRECDMIEGDPESVEIAKRRIAKPFGRAGKKIIKNEDQIGLEL